MAGRIGGIARGVMRISMVWIAAQLNRPEFGGVAGTYVAELDLNRAHSWLRWANYKQQPVVGGCRIKNT